jgi:hypothetical protein
VQWRKDGAILPGATNIVLLSAGSGRWRTVLTVTNVQAADAGIYDTEVFGSQWIVNPQIKLSIQLSNGPGLFQSPRFDNTNFVSDLLGVAGRQYAIEWSADLITWNSFTTLSNATGTATFTNAPAPDGTRFYRARLLP